MYIFLEERYFDLNKNLAWKLLISTAFPFTVLLNFVLHKNALLFIHIAIPHVSIQCAFFSLQTPPEKWDAHFVLTF
jgi:hypothetical protein